MPMNVFKNDDDVELKMLPSTSNKTVLPPLKLKEIPPKLKEPPLKLKELPLKLKELPLKPKDQNGKHQNNNLLEKDVDVTVTSEVHSLIGDDVEDNVVTPRTSFALKNSKSMSHLFSYKKQDAEKDITTARCSSHTDLTKDYSDKDLESFRNAMRRLAVAQNQNDNTLSESKPVFLIGDSIDSDEEEIAENEYTTKLKSKLMQALKTETTLLNASWPQIPLKSEEERSEENLESRSVCSDSELLSRPINKCGEEISRSDELTTSSIMSSPQLNSSSSDDEIVSGHNLHANSQATGAMPLLLSSQARQRSFLVGGLTKHQSLLGSDELHRYFPDKRLGLFVGTWNMQRRGIPKNLEEFLIPKQEELMMDMYVIGLQEATQDQDKWELKLQNTLGPNYVLAHSVSHGVLHIAVLMRRDLIWFCSAFESDKATTRMVSQIKTKGAVAVSFQFFGTSMLFVSSHFRSGETRCKERIDDFNKISEKLQLPKRRKKGTAHTTKLTDRFDCVFWFGDLNFRISRPREIMQDEVNKPHEYDFHEVLKGDQLLAMMRKDRIFHGFTEPEITFLPTYKFNPGTNEYDVTKMRVPSYTDRILSKCKDDNSLSCFRYKSVPAIRKSDHRPVYGLYHVTLKPGKNNSAAVAGGQFRHDVYKKAVELRENNLTHSQSTVCTIL